MSKARNSINNQLNLLLMKKIFFTCAMVTALTVISVASASCNVTRTITTTSSAYQKGDTCIQIVTKTTEIYDATKKGI